MTKLRRVTISLPEEIDEQILALRAHKAFARCSYSAIVRHILQYGLCAMQRRGAEQDAAEGGRP